MVSWRVPVALLALVLVATLIPALPAQAVPAQAVPTQAAPVTNAPAQAAPAYSISRCGNTSGRAILTFDDWAYGDPYRAVRVGAYLKSRHVRAMFLLINKDASKYQNIIAELRRQGHWVANHTWSHPNLTTLSDQQVYAQIYSGVKSNVLRPPYGAWNARVQRIAASQGYRLCLWTVDTRDWEKPGGRYRTVDSIRQIVRAAPATSKRNGVILGHLNTNYPNAVGGILDDLIRQGIYPCLNRGPVGVNVPNPLACN